MGQLNSLACKRHEVDWEDEPMKWQINIEIVIPTKVGEKSPKFRTKIEFIPSKLSSSKSISSSSRIKGFDFSD